MRHRRERLIGISVIGLAFGILILVMGPTLSVWSPPWLGRVAVSAGVLGLLLTVVVDLYVRRAWRSANAAGALDERYTVTTDYVEFESRQGSIRVLATAVTKVHTAPEFWMVWATAYPPMGICRDAFNRRTPLPSTRCWPGTDRARLRDPQSSSPVA